MKKNDIVETKENLIGIVKKVSKGSSTVTVEFRVKVDNTDRHIIVIAKLNRQSLKIKEAQ